jgi:hypothetical protein
MKNSLQRFVLFSRRHLIGNSLKFLGVAGALCVFEACYGTPQADYPVSKLDDVDVSGTLRTHDGAIMANAKVELTGDKYGDTLMTYTDASGSFIFYDVKCRSKEFHLLYEAPAGEVVQTDFTIAKEDMAADKKHIDLTL